MAWIPDDWTFRDDGVADRFDAHVRETLPWYDLATHGAAHLARSYLPPSGLLYDIGASTGNMGRALADTIAARDISLTAIEASPQMAERYDGPGTCVVADATAFDFQPFDVAVGFLVLMFMPVRQRHDFVERLLTQARPGGAVIFVDKVHTEHGYLGSTLHRWTMEQKRYGGISPAEIAEKELSLAGTQRPIRDGFLTDLGFVQWLRIGEFGGWIRETPHRL